MMQLELVLKCYMHVLMILSLCVWLKSVWNWKNDLVVSLCGNCCGGKVSVSSHC